MDDISSYLTARMKIYSFLGSFYYSEADEKYIEMLISFLPVIKSVGEQHSINEISEGADLLLPISWSADFADVAGKEFTKVFYIGDVFKNIKPVTPHESVYLSLSGLTMQAERDNVMDDYYKQGVARQDTFTEPEDHIKAEFDFISIMTQRAIELIKNEDKDALIKNIESQYEFIKEHISRWVYAMCDDVIKNSSSNYFKGFAVITKGFIKADVVFLSEMLDVLREKY